MIYDRDEIALWIRNQIIVMLGDDQIGAQIDRDTLIKDTGMDSLKTVNLIVKIEQFFDVMFEDEEMLIENFATIDKMTEHVRHKLGIRA